MLYSTRLFIEAARCLINNSARPYNAPARVDCTKCDVPTLVAANSNPGPSIFKLKPERLTVAFDATDDAD
tara:strand:- start:1818 stop:2027 length:210 start_codon:yes stop_codon:yes gene_type:complete